MATGIFSPDGVNAQASRPLPTDPPYAEGWFQDVSAPGAGNGTAITASFLNQLVANLREIISRYGGPTDGSDAMLADSLDAAFMSPLTYDPNGYALDVYDADNIVEGSTHLFMTVGERGKLDYITLTGPTDLDQMQADTDTAIQAAIFTTPSHLNLAFGGL